MEPQLLKTPNIIDLSASEYDVPDIEFSFSDVERHSEEIDVSTFKLPVLPRYNKLGVLIKKEINTINNNQNRKRHFKSMNNSSIYTDIHDAKRQKISISYNNNNCIKVIKEENIQNIVNIPKKRGRGRPKGSKNKNKNKNKVINNNNLPKRGRGRPKGSKNKKTIKKNQDLLQTSSTLSNYVNPFSSSSSSSSSNLPLIHKNKKKLIKLEKDDKQWYKYMKKKQFSFKLNSVPPLITKTEQKTTKIGKKIDDDNVLEYYNCDQCRRTFHNYWALNAHKKAHKKRIKPKTEPISIISDISSLNGASDTSLSSISPLSVPNELYDDYESYATNIKMEDIKKEQNEGNNTFYNPLWWYPEISFGEVDPNWNLL